MSTKSFWTKNEDGTETCDYEAMDKCLAEFPARVNTRVRNYISAMETPEKADAIVEKMKRP